MEEIDAAAQCARFEEACSDFQVVAQIPILRIAVLTLLKGAGNACRSRASLDVFSTNTKSLAFMPIYSWYTYTHGAFVTGLTAL